TLVNQDLEEATSRQLHFARFKPFKPVRINMWIGNPFQRGHRLIPYITCPSPSHFFSKPFPIVGSEHFPKLDSPPHSSYLIHPGLVRLSLSQSVRGWKRNIYALTQQPIPICKLQQAFRLCWLKPCEFEKKSGVLLTEGLVWRFRTSFTQRASGRQKA